MAGDLNRREILKFTAGTVAAARITLAQEHKFFTANEFAMVDELSEIIIPADEKSGGAKAAKVAAYIDGHLAEAFEDEQRQEWRRGLAVVDKLARKLNHVGFVEGTPKQREAVVLQMAQNESKPKAPEEVFFGVIKAHTIHAYYTSSIGIHNDMDYKGNVLQTKEYAGVLPEGPALGNTTGTK